MGVCLLDRLCCRAALTLIRCRYDTDHYIQGAGGGGGKGGGGGNRTPTEADDTLQSVQFANVLDLISEGEIQGLDDGNKSIFLDDTAVQNSDGTNNFAGYTVVTRNGTQAQNHIPGPFNAVERETAVGIEVTNGLTCYSQHYGYGC